METGSDERSSTSTALFLWMACILGFCGMHRFYLGRTWTGLLYFLTFGLLGVGQLVDLIRLRQIVQDENLKRDAFRALAEKRALSAGARRELPPAPAEGEPDPLEAFRVKLLAAAAARNGRLSVTEGVMATGKRFDLVEAELDAMAKSGYVGISNDPDTGMVVYTFGELTR